MNVMQSGVRAGLVITLAVFLTGIVGFATAVTPVDEERTYYDQVSDITPIVDYTSIDSYTEYNPISNVTGWADNSGVTIEFKETGVTPYIYHHYVSSESVHKSTDHIYQSGMMVEDWSGGIENATWYPLANTIRLEYGNTEVSDQDIVLKKLGPGHYIIGPDDYTRDAHSFSVFFGLYQTDGSGGTNLQHGFTLTFEKDGGVSDKIISINSIEEFMSWDSSWWKMNTSSIFDVNVEVDIPLASNQSLRVEFITADTIRTSGMPGLWLDLYNGKITHGQEHDSAIGDYEEYNGGLSYKSDSAYSSYAEVINDITIDGVKVQDHDSDNVFMYMSFKNLFGSDLANLEDGTTAYMSGDAPFYVGSKTFGFNLTPSSITGMFTLDLDTVNPIQTSTAKKPALVYVKNEESWYPAVPSKNGLYYNPDLSAPGYKSDEVFIVIPGFPKSVEVDTTYPILEYKYVEGDKFVSIADGVTGYWGNFMDKVGGSANSTPYQNGAITLLTEPGTEIYSDTVFWKDLEGNIDTGSMHLTVPSSIPYEMALVTLDFQGGAYYAQGVVWGAVDPDDRRTTNWTLRPYEYPITPEFVREGTGTSDSPSYVEELQFTKSGGTRAFVLTTYVQTDPLGKLWGNPTVYLAYYYPDYYVRDDQGNTGIPGSALRVLFNAFVASGTSMTINGQVMPIADGNITFTYYTTETEMDNSTNPPTEITVIVTNSITMPIKGMAVDWEDGHVYLVFTEQGKTRYDLGVYDQRTVDVIVDGEDTHKNTIQTDVISATGTWYWQSNIYTIHHGIETVMKLDLSKGIEGWGMSMQTSLLLFVAMMILCVAIVHYFYRDSDDPMSITDWIIIGIAIFLSIGVAVT